MMREMWNETREASLCLIRYFSADTKKKVKENVIHDSELLSWDLMRIPAEYKTENIFSVPVRSTVLTVRRQEHWMTFAMIQFLLFWIFLRRLFAYLLQTPRHFTKLTQTAHFWKRNHLFDTATTKHMLHNKKHDLLIWTRFQLQRNHVTSSIHYQRCGAF